MPIVGGVTPSSKIEIQNEEPQIATHRLERWRLSSVEPPFLLPLNIVSSAFVLFFASVSHDA